MALQEFDIVSGQFNSLFQLKLLDDNPSPDDNPSLIKLDKAMMQSQQLLDSFHTKPLNEKIYQVVLHTRTLLFTWLLHYVHSKMIVHMFCTHATYVVCNHVTMQLCN